MIPKIIHYCWFGRGDKGKKAEMCIASWKRLCPDYEIIEWNEDNFDIHMNAYTEMCYRERKFAFLSDYARLLVVSRMGGIYFDLDVEVVKSPDDLLHNTAFFGFEDDTHIATGLGFGAEADCEAINALLAAYDPLLDGRHGVIGCPILNTDALVAKGLRLDGSEQELGICHIYPAEYFNPYDDHVGELNKTRHTYSIHWYAKSWMSRKQVFRSKLSKPWHRFLRWKNGRAQAKAMKKAQSKGDKA